MSGGSGKALHVPKTVKSTRRALERLNKKPVCDRLLAVKSVCSWVH
jgi:hypothetical protein